MSKSLKVDIVWEVHKRTQQRVSAKLESYIYRVHMVYATSSCLSHFLLKATMLYTCDYGVMCLLYHPKEKEKKRKIKIVSIPVSHNNHEIWKNEKL